MQKLWLVWLIASVCVGQAAAQDSSRQVLYSPEGNRLRRYDIDSIGTQSLLEDIFIDRASSGPSGRDINGKVCLFPDGSGRFIAGEDTGQPAEQEGESPGTTDDVPPGWGVFDATGHQVGKLTATYHVIPGDPFGCAFDAQGRLFTTEIGHNNGLAPFNGQLLMWFPPFNRFPGAPGTYPNSAHSDHFCKIASDIGVATSTAIDELGRVYVTSAAGPNGGSVLRFSPPFPTAPTAAGGCGGVDSLGSPVADVVNAEVFISDPSGTPSGIVRAPNGNWYVASVFTGVIAEYDPNGVLVRRIVESPAGSPYPLPNGHPQGLALDRAGTLYYADLSITVDLGPPLRIGPGPNGKIWRVTFDSEGRPQPPEIVRQNLQFPDAVAVLPGDLTAPPCPGDCDQSGTVTLDELIRSVNIALGHLPIDECALVDTDDDRHASVDELVGAVAGAVSGCGSD